jgi:hypothetical protein
MRRRVALSVTTLVSSAVVMLGATGILVGAFYLNTLYLQNVLGHSALKTGLSFLPLALVIFAAAHLGSHLLPHAGSRVVALGGLALMAIGALLLAAAPDRASYTTDLLPGFLLLGAGVGLVFVALTVTAMAGVRHAQAGLASGNDDHGPRARRRIRRGRPGGRRCGQRQPGERLRHRVPRRGSRRCGARSGRCSCASVLSPRARDASLDALSFDLTAGGTLIDQRVREGHAARLERLAWAREARRQGG